MNEQYGAISVNADDISIENAEIKTKQISEIFKQGLSVHRIGIVIHSVVDLRAFFKDSYEN